MNWEALLAFVAEMHNPDLMRAARALRLQRAASEVAMDFPGEDGY